MFTSYPVSISFINSPSLQKAPRILFLGEYYFWSLLHSALVLIACHCCTSPPPPPSCSFFLLLLYHCPSALSLSLCSSCHRRPVLTSPLCFVIVLVHSHRGDLISPWSIIVPLALSLFPLLCHRQPGLSLFHCSVIDNLVRPCSTALSSSTWCVIVPLLCHCQPGLSLFHCSVIVNLVCHCSTALSSSTWSVILPLLCHCHLFCPCSTPLSSSACSVIVRLICHHRCSGPCMLCGVVYMLCHRLPELWRRLCALPSSP